MEKSKIAGKKCQWVELKKGETYAWCACGRSANQPWCDGSHQGSRFSPLVFTADESKTAAMCMCKQTKTPPYCDGTHKNLEE